MTWLLRWLARSRIGQWLALLVTGAIALLLSLRRARKQGAEDALRDAQIEDQKHADAIRRRVERDLPDRLREFEGRGFRDD